MKKKSGIYKNIEIQDTSFCFLDDMLIIPIAIGMDSCPELQLILDL
ncbi:MAG: hypothetical protein J7577_20125 [Sphingobacteriaceae bacterium]|nr:hypothetical protein [Sphingobacteriaceae bacterium]